jgi:adenine phosphoribosyltransferase
MDFKSKITITNDWPRPGIVTYDIAPLLRDAEMFKFLIDNLVGPYKEKNIDSIIGIESRGFIIASAMADRLGVGMNIIRKKGKIPPPVLSQDYSYEYASQVIEIAENTLQGGQKILIVDDILATGGTMAAAIKLIKKTGVEIAGMAFVVEMDSMAGRLRLQNIPVHAIVHYN